MREIDLNVNDMERRFGVTEKRRASCEAHGDYASLYVEKREHWSGCPECARLEQTQRELEEDQRERERRASAKVQALLGRAAIPPRFAEKTFDLYRVESEGQGKVLAACQDYAETFPERLEDGRCMLLLGTPGTGKTHLACAVGIEVIQRHRMSAVYSTVSEAVRSFKDNWTSHERKEADILESYAKPSLLILDEIGMGWGSETELLYLFEIINARYQAKRPTIVVGNIPRDQVRQCLGDRVADRLNEAGCRVIQCKWPSMRDKL